MFAQHLVDRLRRTLDDRIQSYSPIRRLSNERSIEESKVREMATDEVMTAKRAIGIGLVDEIGDFQDTLEVAAVAAGCKPAPKWIRPSRSFTQQMFARNSIGRQAGGLSVLDGLQRIMSGGIYYLDPGHISGGDYSLSSQE